jgi:hypothetical protein
VDQDAIIQYISGAFTGVDVSRPQAGDAAPEIAWGDTFFIYDPHRDQSGAGQFPFATLVTKDYGHFDKASNLNRPGVFRLNLGLTRDTYHSLFGPHPAPPAENSAVETGHDFTALDQLMPHPIYAPQSWVCILNPSASTFETLKPLLAEAYQLAVNRYNRRQNP